MYRIGIVYITPDSQFKSREKYKSTNTENTEIKIAIFASVSCSKITKLTGCFLQIYLSNS